MIELLFRVVVLLASNHDAEALQRTAPEPIEIEVARENLAAARIAGIAYRIDPDLALAVAAHESRYKADAIGPESGGRVSCGSMTPEPVANCSARQTTLDGYLAGVAPRRGWIGATASMHEALLGYAGGYRLIKACRVGPVVVR